jgi:ketosteroid isomerase-like protein
VSRTFQSPNSSTCCFRADFRRGRQIRQLIASWAGAIRDKNIEAAVSHYARDILLYDLAPPLVHRGVDYGSAAASICAWQAQIAFVGPALGRH